MVNIGARGVRAKTVAREVIAVQKSHGTRGTDARLRLPDQGTAVAAEVQKVKGRWVPVRVR